MIGWLVRDGKSTGEICELLNLNGIKSRTGLLWSHAVIRKILSNPALHRGWFIWGSPDHGSDDARSHKTKIGRDGNPIYGLPKRVALPDPPLTEREFKAVQRALKAHPRAQSVQRESVSRPLTGRLFGSCGRHYTGTSIAGKTYDVYRCTGNRFRGNEAANLKCGCKQINAQKIEKRIWSEVAGLISDPDKLQLLAKDWLETQVNSSDSSGIEIEALDNKEDKIRRAISRIQDDYYLADSKEQDSLRERMENFRADLALVQERKKLISAYLEDSALQAKQFQSLADLAESARLRIANLTMAEQQDIYELLRIRVVISEIENSEPNVITVFGHIDSRISSASFMDGENQIDLPRIDFKIPKVLSTQ
jgi:hypothetical protein